MLEKNHNDNSKQFMQKVLVYIDSVLINASESNSDSINKVLVGGILNVRDAIFSELIRDNHIDQLNQLVKESAKKNSEGAVQDLSLEKESAKDQ